MLYTLSALIGMLYTLNVLEKKEKSILIQLPGLSMELQVLPIHSSIHPSIVHPSSLKTYFVHSALLDAMVHVVAVVYFLSHAQLL